MVKDLKKERLTPSSNPQIFKSSNSKFVSLFLEWAMVHRPFFAPVLPLRPDEETAFELDLSKDGPHAANVDVRKPQQFEDYLNVLLKRTGTSMAIGGYLEHRNLYADKQLFNSGDNQSERFIHLGIDAWMPAGTKIFAPLAGKVHSFADNDSVGNYGPTIILKHEPITDLVFYTLYGHLSRSDLNLLSVGKRFEKGECLAHFGKPEENGFWSPHLHFQIILNMGNYFGDYPGVASLETIAFEKSNCPDPNIIFNCPLI
jgi:murein DD-endopeptidase MepM/ murein hydrolase activator NlpD